MLGGDVVTSSEDVSTGVSDVEPIAGPLSDLPLATRPEEDTASVHDQHHVDVEPTIEASEEPRDIAEETQSSIQDEIVAEQISPAAALAMSEEQETLEKQHQQVQQAQQTQPTSQSTPPHQAPLTSTTTAPTTPEIVLTPADHEHAQTEPASAVDITDSNGETHVLSAFQAWKQAWEQEEAALERQATSALQAIESENGSTASTPEMFEVEVEVEMAEDYGTPVRVSKMPPSDMSVSRTPEGNTPTPSIGRTSTPPRLGPSLGTVPEQPGQPEQPKRENSISLRPHDAYTLKLFLEDIIRRNTPTSEPAASQERIETSPHRDNSNRAESVEPLTTALAEVEHSTDPGPEGSGSTAMEIDVSDQNVNVVVSGVDRAAIRITTTQDIVPTTEIPGWDTRTWSFERRDSRGENELRK